MNETQKVILMTNAFDESHSEQFQYIFTLIAALLASRCNTYYILLVQCSYVHYLLDSFEMHRMCLR